MIRQRYAFACGYCGGSEVSAGGILTVDHHCPMSAGGDDSLDNLVYACIRCNQHKYTYWPTKEEIKLSFRVLHPLQDVLAQHYRLNLQTGRLEALTETGRFHITLLHLNRPQLVRHRLTQQLREVMEGKLALLERQIHELEETITAQERYIAALE
ncbi:MAG: HNH endonuclease signature motif containing protein, partial [Caldilineaceae bacterium]